MKTLLLLLFLVCAGQATTLTGTLSSPTGGNANGTLIIAGPQVTSLLPACGGSNSNGYTVPTVNTTVTSGVLGIGSLTGNDCFSPNNTFYTVTFTDSTSHISYTTTWVITGASVNVGNFYFGTQGPVMANPTGNQVVAQPNGTSLYVNNLAVTGSIQCPGAGCGGGGGSGTVTSVTLAGTANEITATGTCSGVTTISCTLLVPSGFILPGTIDGLTITTTTGTLTITGAKVLTVSNSLTLAGTDGVTLTFPATNATIARTDAGQTFTGTQTFSTPIAPGSGGSGVANTSSLTLGSSNQNWATLGTGIIKNTTTTGALTVAASSDVIGLFSTCSGTQYLGADGSCHTPPGANSVFTGSTGSTISSSATPAFSLSDVSVKSPIRFQISPVINVTGPTITNTTAGATFSIAVTTDGTHTWSWNSIITDGVCPIWVASAATTVATIQVDQNGTTLHGIGCVSTIAGLTFFGAAVSAPSTDPGSGNIVCQMTAHGNDCLDHSGNHWVQVEGASGATSNSFVTYVDASGGVHVAQPSFSNISGTAAATQIPAVSFPTPTSSATLSGNSEIFVCTTTCTVTVPVPAAGVQYCVYNDDNVSTVITMSAIGSSASYENTARTAYGTAGTGTFVSTGAVGDGVCIVGRDSTHYLTPYSKGSWTAN